jgi:hypothetical protein
MLATPRYEFPEFPAALSFVMVLGPEETLAVLERRAAGLRDRLGEFEHELDQYQALPRVALLETEYLRVVTAAELAWVAGVLDELRAGSLAWTAEDLDPAKFVVTDPATEP